MNLLLPNEFKKANVRVTTASLVGDIALTAAMAEIPSIRDYLIVQSGVWEMAVFNEGLTFRLGQESLALRRDEVSGLSA